MRNKKNHGKTRLLDFINSPEDLKKLPIHDLPFLAEEIREKIIGTVSHTGGHLATNLGIVEISIALHYLLNSPADKIVWDVGHQCYVHKMLTGRKNAIHTIRQTKGLSGFPNIFESPHDHFTVGHASTAVSQALGLATARDLLGEDYNVVALVGDGSLTGGMCYEALNNCGHTKRRMTVILNDNEMAISKSIGAMHKYLNKILTAPLFNRIRSEIEKRVQSFPPVLSMLRHIEESLKNLLVPGIVFEELGVRYFGPIDGHDIDQLIETLKNVLKLDEPCLLHVITKKGKGYEFAEQLPHKYHSASPFSISTGKADEQKNVGEETAEGDAAQPVSYTRAFSDALLDVSEKNGKIVAITAAMPEGTGLDAFQKKYPTRFFDVGIAEEHAVTFAGALARGGLKPVCAIYSTFLQRGYDQLIHDVALQNANVVFCLDRSGLVGADGPTHHGLFDFAFMRSVPGSVVAAPCDAHEMMQMVRLGITYDGVFSLRYPKGNIPQMLHSKPRTFAIGEGEVLVNGEDVLILTLGNMVDTGFALLDELKNKEIFPTLCNMRFVKPLDEALLVSLVKKHKKILTIEEHVVEGGFGSAVLEFLSAAGIHDVSVTVCGLPNTFIEHGSREYLLDLYNLSPVKLSKTVMSLL